ncbi:MAG: type I-E CRISPR-associated protein Cse2/CasB [Methermicoccaceae archaeon]
MTSEHRQVFAPGSAECGALLKWWRSLDERRGDRATLRRCRNPTEVAFNPAFHRLRRSVGFQDAKPWESEAMAVIAGVLSHIKEYDGRRKFAEQMGANIAGGDRKLLSELRFRRLLTAHSREELYVPLVRTIGLLGKRANVCDVAYSIYYWGDWVRKRWAYDYYGGLVDEGTEVAETRGRGESQQTLLGGKR